MDEHVIGRPLRSCPQTRPLTYLEPYEVFVVEVPGIEPGSFGIKTGLLRA
jgi:hypothetical protein